MKRLVFLSVLFGAMPLLSMAQDDLYFTPSKAEQSAYQQNKIEEDRPVYYSGIGKSNDEYNRRGKYNYKKIGVDSLGNDIFMSRVSTLHGDSVVLDTIYGGFTRQYESDNDDFAYSRRMSRFDGFWGGYYDPWFAGRSSFYVGRLSILLRLCWLWLVQSLEQILWLLWWLSLLWLRKKWLLCLQWTHWYCQSLG